MKINTGYDVVSSSNEQKFKLTLVKTAVDQSDIHLLIVVNSKLIPVTNCDENIFFCKFIRLQI